MLQHEVSLNYPTRTFRSNSFRYFFQSTWASTDYEYITGCWISNYHLSKPRQWRHSVVGRTIRKTISRAVAAREGRPLLFQLDQNFSVAISIKRSQKSVFAAKLRLTMSRTSNSAEVLGRKQSSSNQLSLAWQDSGVCLRYAQLVKQGECSKSAFGTSTKRPSDTLFSETCRVTKSNEILHYLKLLIGIHV